MLRFFKKIIPVSIFRLLQPIYHYKMALISVIFYGFPSRKIKVIGVTGTKGKSTVTEIISSILEEAGFKVALSNTIRFKIGKKEERNLYKMTMPGRFFIQKFLKDAVNAKCDWAVLEMTSEGVKQFRHKFIELDALVVTNVSPEHIESHGSFEKYLITKLELAVLLAHSKKLKKVLVTNKDDEYSSKFINAATRQPARLTGLETFSFSLEDTRPYEVKNNGINLTFRAELIESPLRGLFNVQNILAAAVFAESQGISSKIIAQSVSKISRVPGRVEFVSPAKTLNLKPKTLPFDVIVDYAHTIDSLTKLYEAFPNQKKICVLGNTGGGRDKWKRKGMAEVADTYCDQIILTNEDPYDEDPMEILNQMKEGIRSKPYQIILDRRIAIRTALEFAFKLKPKTQNLKPLVLITGKGTDPYIMGPRGSKVPWDDAEVVREELEKLNA